MIIQLIDIFNVINLINYFFKGHELVERFLYLGTYGVIVILDFQYIINYFFFHLYLL